MGWADHWLGRAKEAQQGGRALGIAPPSPPKRKNIRPGLVLQSVGGSHIEGNLNSFMFGLRLRSLPVRWQVIFLTLTTQLPRPGRGKEAAPLCEGRELAWGPTPRPTLPLCLQLWLAVRMLSGRWPFLLPRASVWATRMLSSNKEVTLGLSFFNVMNRSKSHRFS